MRQIRDVGVLGDQKRVDMTRFEGIDELFDPGIHEERLFFDETDDGF